MWSFAALWSLGAWAAVSAQGTAVPYSPASVARGKIVYLQNCQDCHGEDGNGVTALAPPLNKSEIVNGNKTVMISILLKGLSGPVKIAGHLYKAPEISGEMPGFADNKDFTDDDLAQVMNFVRRSWQNKGDKVNAVDVKNLRKKLESR